MQLHPEAQRVSIVMPAFNSGRTIAASVQSVLDQTHQNWELLIVDDGSSDDTRDVVRPFLSDRRIRLLTGAGRGGPARARNAGLDAATGDVIAFLDSDDLWLPHKTATQLAFMAQNGARICFSAYWRVGANGVTRRGRVDVPPHVTYESLLRTNSIGCLTAMYDRRLFPDARMPEVSRSAEGTWLHRWLDGRVGHEDYAFWLALLRSPLARGRVGFAGGINEPMALYRLSANSLSGNKMRAAAFQWLVYRRVEQLSLPLAVACFLGYAYHGLRKGMRDSRAC